jgi:hypothetical protein
VKELMKKTEDAKPKPSKFTKSNYRRATDGVEVRRVTFDLPEELLHRWTVHAAKLRTTKVEILRELLEKAIPPL